MPSSAILNEIRGFTNSAQQQGTPLIRLQEEVEKADSDMMERNGNFLNLGKIPSEYKPMHERNHDAVLRGQSKFRKLNDKILHNKAIATVTMNNTTQVKTLNELCERSGVKGQIVEEVVNNERYSTFSRRRSTTPSVNLPAIHERLYEDAVMRKTKLSGSTEENAEKPVVVAPTKTINPIQATELYERLVNAKAETARKTIKMAEQMNTNRSSMTPKRLISISKASAFYERSMEAKRTKDMKRLEMAKSNDRETQRNAIPLSKAIGIYERGLQSKLIFLYKMEQEKKIKRWR